MDSASLFDAGPPPPCPAPFNMADHVLTAGRRSPDKCALSVLGQDSREDWSFAELEAAVRGIAAGLTERGYGPGARIVLRLGNRPEYPLAYLGAIAADMVPVPTSPQLTEREVAAIFANLAPAAVLTEYGIASAPHPQSLPLAEVRQMMRQPGTEYVTGDPERPAYIVYTSGTSGTPRAVEHAHRAIWARRMMHDGWYGLRPEDRVLHAGAFNWTYTMGTGLMDPWSVGATALIPAPGTPPETLPHLIAEHSATIFAAAPGVYRKFLKQNMNWQAPALRHGLSAGEKLSPTLRSLWQDVTGTPVLEAYGMSECSTFISAPPGAALPEGATGRPQNGRRIALLDEAGAPVPLGQDGTIAVHRSDPGLMRGYVGAPEATRDKFIGDWFLTGDHASMDAEGWITYLGRRDDMMNAGGFRVSPLEVEAALAGLPGAETLAVTDIEVKPDVRVILCFYTAAAPGDPETMRAFASSRLAAYKQPKDYIHIDALPTGPNGKLARAALQTLWRDHDQA
jgi:acyl-coenzyme A synthetase/AMP-(fatty) acid ligase